MRRIYAFLLAAVLAAGTLCACGGTARAGTQAAQEKKKSVVATIFPEYDWVRNILGENPAGVELTLLMDRGVDLHSYQPTADDILKISTCDLFIYVGGESDAWVEKALEEAENRDMATVSLMEALGDRVREEEVVEGMQEENHDHEEGEEDQDHEDGEDHDHEEGPEYDEHVWLSLKNAQVLVDAIAGKLAGIDAANAQVYEANAKAYSEKLAALDAEYAAAVQAGARKTVLFADRFPFRYLADDYGLTCYAAFEGCSAEAEASFETVAFLAEKLDELSLPCVLTLENSDQKIAQTVVDSTSGKDQKILVINSLQSVTAQEAAEGADYISLMEDNLTVLEEALR